jgi:hypothetical protein
MIPRSDKELLGPNNLHLPKIIEVFTKVNSSCFSFLYDQKILWQKQMDFAYNVAFNMCVHCLDHFALLWRALSCRL